MKRIHQQRERDSTQESDSSDPFTNWHSHCKKSGVETELEREISKGILGLNVWIKKHSIPLAVISGLLFFGSLRIADSSHRSNAKYNTLEIIQIESLLTAKNALVIGISALSAWYCVRKVKL